MTFDEYSDLSLWTDRDPLGPAWYPTLGLAGEVGEVVEHVKKFYRDGKVPERHQMLEELGGVLWYLSGVARRASREFGYAEPITLDEVGKYNIHQLNLRSSLGKEEAEKFLERQRHAGKQ